MKKLWMILMMLFVTGCSQAVDAPIPSPVPITQAVAGDDIYPVLYGKNTDADPFDEYFIAAEAFSTGLYSRVQIGTDDFLPDTWVAQRNAVVYMTDGQWGIVAIEAVSADLELWMAPQNGWDISGVWTLIDDDNFVDYSSTDVVSKQNGFHTVNILPFAANGASIFPDGAGNWIIYDLAGDVAEHYSTTLDNNLAGWVISYNNNFIILHNYESTAGGGIYSTAEADDQIITDEHGNIWLFDLDAINNDLDVAIFDDIYSIMIEDDTALNAISEEVIDIAGFGNTLVDYNAVTNFSDNTIHVVAVSYATVIADVTYSLNYYRRDQNGWNDAVTIDSWEFDTTVPNDILAFAQQQLGTFPQISIRNNHIVVYYLEAIPDDPAYRDLRRMYLDDLDYNLYGTPGEWVPENNIDDSIHDIKFCLTLGNHPEI